MKRAFFVLGAEGSGTRMLTAAFIAAGCRGSADHAQPLDNLDFTGDGDLVFRRSLPHGGEWSHLREIAWAMTAAGYAVVPVYLKRDQRYLVAHQLRTDREHKGVVSAPYAATPDEALQRIRHAEVFAYGFADDFGIPMNFVSYEAFVDSRRERRFFFEKLGLTFPEGAMEFYNANDHPRYAALPW